jgi:hypothetical protein
MEALMAYLTENPLVGILLAGLVLSMVWSIVKKLLKVAVILGLIFLSSSGATYHFAQLDLAERGKQILKQTEKKIHEVRKQIPGLRDTSGNDSDSNR